MNRRERTKWRRLKRAARLVADRCPPTARGWLVAALSASALLFLGYGTLDLLLFVIGVAGLALVALASLLVAAIGLYLKRRLRDAGGEAQRLEAGSPVRTGLRVPALGALPMVGLDWRWLEPAGVEVRARRLGGELVEEVVAERRAQVPAVRRRFSVGDVFGLARFSWQATDKTPLTILPHVGRLRRMPVVRSLASAEGVSHPSGAPEGDRMDIRRYVPGDSARHLLWKTFARTRQLNVRIPERSVERSRKTVAYLVAGEGDEPAAAAARVALESGSLGQRWLFGADGTSDVTGDLDAALEAIARSGSRATNGASNGRRPAAEDGLPGLSAFLERMRSEEGEVRCIVFAPARAGAWSEATVRLARAAELSFVLGLDGVVRAEPPSAWQRLLFRPEAVSGTPREELTEVVRRLAAAGCPALVVDRSNGRSYGEGGRALPGGRR